jgi:SRSO17 transposase
MRICSLKAFSETSNARPVGCGLRPQAILGRRNGDADALRDIVRDYVIEHLADDDAVLAIDENRDRVD